MRILPALPAVFCLAVYLLSSSCALAAEAMAPSGAAATPFTSSKEYRLGELGGWDYLTLDAAGSRLFITRADRVMVMSTSDGKMLGRIAETVGVHGVALAPALGLGFTSNGRTDNVTAFDLATLATRRVIDVHGKNPDAILYEPLSKRLLTFNGRSQDISIIDPVPGTVLAVVPVGGKPEFAVADDAGTVFVNIEDTAELLALDPVAGKVLHRWALQDCSEPTGLDIDRRRSRLFSVCGNGVMVVTDAVTGRQVAKLPIGDGADAAVYDAQRDLVFSSNGQSGTLTVVKTVDADHYQVLANLPTKRSARTMALDPHTHHVFLVAAEFGTAPAPTEAQPHPRPPVLDGSFAVLELIP